MASYYVPTVVQTTIPNIAMTPLERLVLSNIFSAEADDDGLYFFAEESPAECIEVDAAELKSPTLNTPMGPRLFPAKQVRNVIERMVRTGSISGPKATPSSMPLPTFMVAMRAANFSAKAS